MPLFAYVCKSCNALVELLVNSNEQVTCPSCGSSRLERQLSRITPGRSGAAEPTCSSCERAGGGCCPLQSGGMS